MSRPWRRPNPTAALAAMLLGAAAVALLLLTDPVTQDPAYHVLVDRRTLLGIPHALDVLSNLPFALVGWLGLSVALRAEAPFADRWERGPAVALFGGTLLVAFGSAWYHLAPSDERLAWDRLPMTVAFMGLLTGLIAERLSLALARRTFLPALLFGAGSVVYWRLTDRAGAGDLRPYALAQYGTLLAVVLLAALRPPGRAAAGAADTRWLVAALAGYVVAKLFEALDQEVFALGGVVSGHTLKHLAAAASVACLVARLARRTHAAGAADGTAEGALPRASPPWA